MKTEGKGIPSGWRVVPLGEKMEKGDMILLTRHGSGLLWVNAVCSIGVPNTNGAAVIRKKAKELVAPSP